MLSHEEMWKQMGSVEGDSGRDMREKQACRCLCLCRWRDWGVRVKGERGVCVCGEKGGVLGRYGCVRVEGETWWGVCGYVCVCRNRDRSGCGDSGICLEGETCISKSVDSGVSRS